MRRTALVPALLGALALAACGGSGDDITDSDGTPQASAPAEGPVLVITDSSAVDGPGISVAEALTHGPTDDVVLVNGALFIDADGTVMLCDAIAESFPPQCGGERLRVTGLDPDDVPDLQEAEGIRWAERVTLFGSVE